MDSDDLRRFCINIYCLCWLIPLILYLIDLPEYSKNAINVLVLLFILILFSFAWGKSRGRYRRY